MSSSDLKTWNAELRPTSGQDIDIGMLIKAMDFAAEKHRHQRRKDLHKSPYINHPIAVANVLVNEAGIHDMTVLCAAILHDTIEDTDTTVPELQKHFGHRIASIVMEVTDDKELSKEERKRAQVKHAPHISGQAKLVKLADKICNLRDMLASPPHGWPADRKRKYFAWAAEVVGGLRGANAELERIFDEIMSRQGEIS